MKKIIWREEYGRLSLDQIKEAEKIIGYPFPKDYQEMLLSQGCGEPLHDTFSYFNLDIREDIETSIFSFLAMKSEYRDSVLDAYEDPPEFFDKYLVPFANEPGGDYVCFDYRDSEDYPIVVYWQHDSQYSINRVSFLAENFSQFLDMLKENPDYF
jgi:hypothetical protein